MCSNFKRRCKARWRGWDFDFLWLVGAPLPRRTAVWQPVYQSRFAFAVFLIIFPGWFELKIRGHEQGIHPHRRRA
jgi:hypothetical protein